MAAADAAPPPQGPAAAAEAAEPLEEEADWHEDEDEGEDRQEEHERDQQYSRRAQRGQAGHCPPPASPAPPPRLAQPLEGRRGKAEGQLAPPLALARPFPPVARGAVLGGREFRVIRQVNAHLRLHVGRGGGAARDLVQREEGRLLAQLRYELHVEGAGFGRGGWGRGGDGGGGGGG